MQTSHLSGQPKTGMLETLRGVRRNMVGGLYSCVDFSKIRKYLNAKNKSLARFAFEVIREDVVAMVRDLEFGNSGGGFTLLATSQWISMLMEDDSEQAQYVRYGLGTVGSVYAYVMLKRAMDAKVDAETTKPTVAAPYHPPPGPLRVIRR